MSKKPVIKIKIGKHVCAVDKKERYFTTMQRAGVIDDNTLIQYASNDSGMRIEQIAAVYKSLVTQVRELICNGHSVQLGDLGTLYFKVHAKISADLEGAGGAAVTQKWIGFRASKAMRQQLDQVNFQVN